MQVLDSIFNLVILILSVVIHEYAHGYVAYMYGDDTAYYEGRLTLNPIKHLDLFGSILLPLFLFLTNAGFMLGWAKPVPYNPDNLRNRKVAENMVAIAGIVANLLIAVIFGLLLRFAPSLGIALVDISGPTAFYKITSAIVLINLLLAVFNLVPIPPLDGSKVFFSFFPRKAYEITLFFERWGFFVLLFFIVFVWQYFVPVIFWLYTILTGLY